MAKEIKFNIKLSVDGKEQLVTATTSTKELGAAFENARKMAKSFDQSLINFNQHIEAIKNVGESVKGIGDQLSAFSEKMRSLQQSYVATAQATGLSGKELARVRAEAQALGDTFGGDLSEVLRSTNSLAQGFGVSMDEALKLMKDGFISGANVNGEFLDTVREYPRYFKEAGISAEEFVAITTNAAKQGIYSDKGVDTIKEGNLRIREMTTATAQALEGIGISATDVQAQLQAGTLTTFQVMQMVGEKLKELPASASAVGTAIADIFGGPGEDAGLEYIKSLADIELSMDKVREGADEYSKALGAQMERQTAFSVALSSMQEALIGVNAEYGQLISIVGSLLTITGNMAMTLTGIGAAFGKLAGNSKVAAAALTVWNGVAQMGRALNIALGGSAHAAAAGAIALKLAIRGLLIATGVGAVITALAMGLEALVDALDDTGDSAKGMGDALSDSKRAAQDVEQAYKQSFTSTYTNLQTRYIRLAAEWKKLTTLHQRTEWIARNKSAFDELGLSVKSVTDADNVFVKNTTSVVEAFKKRAEAAARQAQLEKLAARNVELKDRIDKRNSESRNRRAKAGDVVSEKMVKTLGLKKAGFKTNAKEADMIKDNGAYRLLAKGAEKVNAYRSSHRMKNNSAAQKADEAELASNQRKMDDIANKLAVDVPTTPKATTPTTPTKGGGGGDSTDSAAERARKLAELREKLDRAISANSIKLTDDEHERKRKEIEDTYQQEKDEIAKSKKEAAKLNGGKLSEGDAKKFAELEGQAEKKKTKDLEALDKERSAKAEALDKERIDAKAEYEEAKSPTGGSSFAAATWKPDNSLEGQLSDIQRVMDATDAYIRKLEELKDKLEEQGETGSEAYKKIIDDITEAIRLIGELTGKAQTVTASMDGGQESGDDWNYAAKALSSFGDAMSSLSQLSGDDVGLNVAGIIAQSLAQVALGYATATAHAGEMGPWGWVAFAASGMAQMLAMVAQIHSATGYATGGIVGGSSTSGDKMLVRVNSGEMILNKWQQRKLFDMLDGKTFAASVPVVAQSAEVGDGLDFSTEALRSSLQGSGTDRVEFRLRGQNLVGAIANTTRIGSKSGRRTNIRI